VVVVLDRDRVGEEDAVPAEAGLAEQPLLLGSVSKTLAPAVGIGWVASPPRLTGVVRAASPFPLVPPVLHQLALAWFIESGSYDRHLRAARQRYRARRRVLLDALARLLPECEVGGAAAGLHLLLRLPQGTNASVVARAAARRGLLVADLDRFRTRPDPDHPALVLGYGNLADSAVTAAVSVLAETIAG
jgi:GntR family transcriptional regulator/MocR family aminotransferase